MQSNAFDNAGNSFTRRTGSHFQPCQFCKKRGLVKLPALNCNYECNTFALQLKIAAAQNLCISPIFHVHFCL
jgi:hypothetical protein